MYIGESVFDILCCFFNVDGELVIVVFVVELKGIVVSKDVVFDIKIDGVKVMCLLLIFDEFVGLKNVIDCFMLILFIFYCIDFVSFFEVIMFKGCKCVYFVDNE